MPLSDGDREWIQRQFDRVHDRINALMERDLQLVEAHEEKHHDPVKKWGAVGGVMALVTGTMEVVKWFFRK